MYCHHGCSGRLAVHMTTHHAACMYGSVLLDGVPHRLGVALQFFDHGVAPACGGLRVVRRAVCIGHHVLLSANVWCRVKWSLVVGFTCARAQSLDLLCVCVNACPLAPRPTRACNCLPCCFVSPNLPCPLHGGLCGLVVMLALPARAQRSLLCVCVVVHHEVFL